MKQQLFIAKCLVLTVVLLAACRGGGNSQSANRAQDAVSADANENRIDPEDKNRQRDSIINLYDLVSSSPFSERVISKQDILFPLKVTDEHGATQYIDRDDWKDLEMFGHITPILARDSSSYYSELGDTRSEFLRIANFDSNKTYIFKKINGQPLLTAIEPLKHNDFTTFYSRFISDKTFRFSRIRFPFTYTTSDPIDEEQVQIYTEQDKDSIPLLSEYFFNSKSYFILLNTDGATMVTLSIIYDGEGAYGREERFEKIDGKWMIIYNSEASD